MICLKANLFFFPSIQLSIQWNVVNLKICILQGIFFSIFFFYYFSCFLSFLPQWWMTWRSGPSNCGSCVPSNPAHANPRCTSFILPWILLSIPCLRVWCSWQDAVHEGPFNGRALHVSQGSAAYQKWSLKNASMSGVCTVISLLTLAMNCAWCISYHRCIS